MRRRELDVLRREERADVEFASAEHQQLELRVVALEEALSARWPRSIVVRARLARRIRASVRDVQGSDFEERRLESASIMVTLPGWVVSR